MSRLLVLGGAGMLGQAVVRAARRRGAAALGLSRFQADVTDTSDVERWADSFRPTAVVNCAAFTRVDDCEAEEEAAHRVNGEAVAELATMTRRLGLPLVHVSTDYVFDGQGDRPYTESDPTGPRSAYGRTKLVGEQAALEAGALVVRTSWLFGPGGPNFVATMVRLMSEGRVPLRVVDDQVGRPTYIPFLATALLDLLAKEARGVVHYGNREAVSWFGFAREIASSWDESVVVEPVPTEAFPRPAPRPAYSVLDVSRFESIVGRRVESWGWGLAEYLVGLRSGAAS